MAFEVRGNPSAQVQRIMDAMMDGIRIEITRTVLIVERKAKQNLTDLSKVDRGFLRNSIDHEVAVSPDAVEGVVFVGAIHGPWVEFGRHGTKSSPKGTSNKSAAAAWPPIQEIREWVKRKRRELNIGQSSGRNRRSQFTKASEREINTVAFLIARKIAQHGIEPTPYLVPAFLESLPDFRVRLARTMQQYGQRAGGRI